MARSSPRLVVFDLAGTTMQDDGSVATIFQQVLASEGLETSLEQIAQVRGASKREAFQRLAVDSEQAKRLFEAFVASICGHYAATPPREVPGTSAIFAWLRDQGIKITLNTGFEREPATTLVEGLGWDRGYFDASVCEDDVDAGRPSPAMILEAMRRTGITDPATVMTVGDTVLDLQAGMAAQAGWVVGVTSGAHNHERLLRTPHTHLIASVAQIRELLR